MNAASIGGRRRADADRTDDDNHDKNMNPNTDQMERLDEGVNEPTVRCEGCGEEVDIRDCHTRSAVAERWNNHMENVHGESV